MATPRCCMLTECRRFRSTARLRLFLVLLCSETCIGRAIAIALFVVLPVTVAAGYASFLFPIYSDNLGLLKSDINNIYVLGQLIVYVCIDSILGAERHRGAHRLVTMSIVLLGLCWTVLPDDPWYSVGGKRNGTLRCGRCLMLAEVRIVQYNTSTESLYLMHVRRRGYGKRSETRHRNHNGLDVGHADHGSMHGPTRRVRCSIGGENCERTSQARRSA